MVVALCRMSWRDPDRNPICSRGYDDTVLRVEALEKELSKARKHSTMLHSNLDGAFTQYHMRYKRCWRRGMT
jgi:hypothetical protein